MPSCVDLDQPVDPLLDQELKDLNAYLKRENITVEPNEAGVYYIEELAGSGFPPERYDTVTIRYTGYLLSGKIIDTSDKQVAIDNDIYDEDNDYLPFTFVLGAYNVISGVQEGVVLMKKGGKARIIFPSYLGYGASNYQLIPPYSSLIFDMELVNIKWAKK